MRQMSSSTGTVRNHDLLSIARLFFDTESTWNNGTSLQQRSISAWPRSGVWRTGQHNPNLIEPVDELVRHVFRRFRSMESNRYVRIAGGNTMRYPLNSARNNVLQTGCRIARQQ